MVHLPFALLGIWFWNFTFSCIYAQDQQAQQMLDKQDKHFFIENKGQWHSDVLYLARMSGLDAWITKYGVSYTFYKLEEAASPNKQEHELLSKFEHIDYNVLGHRVLMQLQNHNANPEKEGKHQISGYFNYLIGNDASKHATNVGLYKEAIVKNIYSGIDLRYYFDKGSLRYDYLVHAGADPSQIVFKLSGANKTYLSDRGQLVFETRFGEVAMADLFVYQGVDKKRVEASFVCMAEERWGFALGKYDKTQELVIDPLIYSTYLGRSGQEEGYGIYVDGSGNVYVTGWTESSVFDVTPGAFQTTLEGFADVFVTKLDASGTALVYSTYLGGSEWEEGYGIYVDGSGNAYVTGLTGSSNFDVTPGAFQTTYGGSGDVFVTKLNATGTALVYSTFLGGSSGDYGYGIYVDGSGNAYVTGTTRSLDFDVTTGAFQTTYGGGLRDVFVTKLNAMGTAMVYSTYLGGGGKDMGHGIYVDGSGNAYVTGVAESYDFDVTSGVFQTTYGGGNTDVFVTKLDASGTALVFSTYLGGSDDDYGSSINVDGSGNVYVTGTTRSLDYDVTSGAFQTTYGGYDDVFVTKFNASGTALVYSTYLGGSNDDVGNGIYVDGSGNAYITGITRSLDYDVTSGAFQTTLEGSADVFVTRLNASGTALVYSTYIGGSSYEAGYGIYVDGSGNAYVTGVAESSNFDVTSGAFQTTYGGGDGDVFVTKLNLSVSQLNRSLSELEILIYPNPASTQFVIVSERGGMFELVDVMGRVLERYEVKKGLQLISIDYPAGTYFIREQISGATQKLIIER